MVRENDRSSGKNGRTDDEIKVTDRRSFTANGILREGVEAGGDEEPREASKVTERDADRSDSAPGRGADSAPAEPAFEHRSLDEPEGVDFIMLINAMAQPALIFLGEVVHPGTGRQEVNLEQARLQIDLLDTLRIKCRGNLTSEEEGLLERILYQLRMLYVTRSSRPVQ